MLPVMLVACLLSTSFSSSDVSSSRSRSSDSNRNSSSSNISGVGGVTLRSRRSAQLSAQLNPPSSTGPCTVLEIEQSSVPEAATWFRLRGADGGAVPSQMSGIDSAEGLWFRRTAPKPPGLSPQGVQAFPFQGTGVFNAGNVRAVVPCKLSAPRTSEAFIVEAWSDRSDLGDGSTAAKLLASSPAMSFSFDDQGFSKGLKFEDFAVEGSGSVPGMMTVTARPNNGTAMAMAKLVSWFGFNALPGDAAALR